MPSFKYNPSNTEGAYNTSIDFIDTEIKKGEKIVATDLVDLYDTDIVNPQDNDALYYDNPTGKWKNGEGISNSSSSCNLFYGYTSDGYTNTVHVDATTSSINRDGTYTDPFISLEECFIWLRECISIPDEYILTIRIHSDLNITDTTSLNHPQGRNILVHGSHNTITNTYDIDFDGSSVTGIDSNLLLNDNHSIDFRYAKMSFDLIYTSETLSEDGTLLNGVPIENFTIIEYFIDVPNIRIDNLSVLDCMSITSLNYENEIMVKEIIPDDTYAMIYLNKKPIIVSDKSIIIIKTSTLNQLRISNSIITSDNILADAEWDLLNDSTLIMNAYQSYNLIINNHDSVFIVGGVIQ